MIKIPLEGRVAKANRDLFTLIDDEDDWLLEWTWYATDKRVTTFYAIRYAGPRNKRSSFYMHREILQPPSSKVWVDHINGNGLDNRRSNLRLTTPTQNIQNGSLYRNSTSGVRGVQWSSYKQRWVANITINTHRIHRQFKTFDERPR